MAPDLSQNRALKIVTHAANNKYAVPAICCYNIESIIASVKAAEAKNSPLLIQLFPWAIHFAGGILVHAAKEAADNAKVYLTSSTQEQLMLKIRPGPSRRPHGPRANP
jgi:fructose-bisphosphate aldolase class II